jgi:hypothetical protein
MNNRSEPVIVSFISEGCRFSKRHPFIELIIGDFVEHFIHVHPAKA